MSTPNLPPLAPNARIATPPVTGEWTSQNVSLDRLADSLSLPDETVSAAELRSIPDVWAQALVFHHALVQDSHPLHQEAVRDWRALLTLFALADVYAKHYQLRIEPVALADEDRGEGVGRRTGDAFRRVLTRMPPTERLPQNPGWGGGVATAEWSRPVLVYVRDRTGGADEAPSFGPAQLAGILNPATLVATGKSGRRLRVASAPWLRNGWEDPTRLSPAQMLSRRDYAVIAQFLTELSASLETIVGDQAGATHNALTLQLNTFGDRCRLLADGFDRPIVASERTARADLPPLYRGLLRPPTLGREAYPVGYSDCALHLRPEFGGEQPTFAGLILYDPELSETLRRRKQDVHVWREHSLKALMDAPGLLAQVRREALEAGYFLVEPGDFFTREFARLGNGAVVDSHPADGPFRSAVLPLSPVALMTLKPQELIGALSLENTGDGASTVVLKLPLVSGAGPHLISRTFAADAGPDGFNVAERVNAQFGLISTWPNFRQEQWRWNFLKLSYNPRMTGLQARFGVSARHLSRALGAETSLERRTEAARAWFDSSSLRLEENEFRRPITPESRGGKAPPFQRLRYLNREDVIEEVQVSTSPFEAVCLARKRTAQDRQARPVGLVLLSQRAVDSVSSTQPATVAVDFGTTNTVACLDNKSPIVFQTRVTLPIFQPSSDADNRRDFKWSFVDFLPLIEYATPIPTVAKRREIDVGESAELKAVADGRDDRPLFSDMIFFQPPLGDPVLNQTRTDVERFKSTQQRLLFNLKWAEDPLTRDVSRRFLREFMLLASAELTAQGRDPSRARWRFSYPEAMRGQDLVDLKENIQRAWTDLFVNVEGGVELDPHPENQPIRPLTSESAAAAKYFLNYNVGGQFAGPLTIVLDIGGGTTDIAVLSNGSPLWRSSFRLAGGDFVTHFLMNHPDYFEHIGLPDLAELRRSFSDQWSTLYPADAQHDNHLKAFGELLFSNDRFGRAMAERYSVASGTPEGKGLRHSAWVFMGGMAYYLGMVVRDLLDQGLVTPEFVGQVTFGLGGRGASLFKRYESAPSPAGLNDLFGLFILGADLDPETYANRRVLSSPQAKMEVVLGMIGEGTADREQLATLQSAPKSTLVPLGEALSVNTGEGAVLLQGREDRRKLQQATEVAYPDELPEFRNFLKGLATLTGVEVDLFDRSHNGAHAFIKQEVFKRAESHVRASNRLRSEGKAPPDLEPSFITALRALLDRMGRPAGERSAYISVKDL